MTDLSKITQVKPNGAVGLTKYEFLLLVVSNSNYMSNSHRLAVANLKT